MVIIGCKDIIYNVNMYIQLLEVNISFRREMFATRPCIIVITYEQGSEIERKFATNY